MAVLDANGSAETSLSRSGLQVPSNEAGLARFVLGSKTQSHGSAGGSAGLRFSRSPVSPKPDTVLA